MQQLTWQKVKWLKIRIIQFREIAQKMLWLRYSVAEKISLVNSNSNIQRFSRPLCSAEYSKLFFDLIS